jgi:UDP-N-acetylglucosamine:LPS N-acetylglucosamine transferase
MLAITMQRIDLVYFNAGGGHRAAALALQAAMAEQRRPWQVRLVNLFEVLDPQRTFDKVMGFAPEAFYNQRLARGWTFGLAQELKLLQGAIRLGHASLVRTLCAHWAATQPDLVVSLVPNFNRALYASVTQARPGVPFATVLTDMADHPPHFWIEPGQDQHVVCGTPLALAQARAAGYDDRRLSLTSGMILRPDFYRPVVQDRAAERRSLGLDPDRPTGVVMFGGHGSMQMARIAQALPQVQLVLLCGHNQALVRKLGRLAPTAAHAPHAVLGFTPEVSRYMRLGDFFIGKPGPASLSEAVQLGLPVITFENASTMPQERWNAHWVREQGLGLVVKSTRTLAQTVAELTARLPEFQARVRQVDNRAVFEILEIFGGLLHAAALARHPSCMETVKASVKARLAPQPALRPQSAAPAHSSTLAPP